MTYQVDCEHGKSVACRPCGRTVVGSTTTFAGRCCGHIREHHKATEGLGGQEVTNCRWQGCGCPEWVE